MSLAVLFLLLLKGSLFSFSGTGNVPILRDDLLARGWATDRQFGEALAIGQLSPGPTGLWVISLGFLTAGWRGAGLALLAITLPPLLILAVDRFYRRIRHHSGVEGFVRGVGLAVVGIFVYVLWNLLGNVGLNARSAAVTLASIALGFTRRVPVIVVLALGALSGVLWR
jgi:chromate transporter